MKDIPFDQPAPAHRQLTISDIAFGVLLGNLFTGLVAFVIGIILGALRF